MARLFDDALSQYLERDEAPVVATPFSFACWFYTDTITASELLFFIGDKNVSSTFYLLILAGTIAGDPIRLQRRVGGGITNTDTTTGFSTNTWQHAAYVCAADNNAAVYLNAGGKATSSVSRAPTNWDRISLGRAGDSTADRYMSGRICEAGLWNAALIDEEIVSLYKRYSPPLVRPQSLVSYWPLIRDEDQDHIGKYNLTAYNTPTIAPHCPIIYPAPPSIPTAPTAAAAALARHMSMTGIAARIG